MRKLKTTLAMSVAASAIAVGLTIVPVIPAVAYEIAQQCSNDVWAHLHGDTSSGSSQSWESRDCGTVYNRAQYANPSGAYWTAWRSADTYASWAISGINIGEHRATYRATFQTVR